MKRTVVVVAWTRKRRKEQQQQNRFAPLPLPFLSAKRIPGEMGGGEEKSIITIPSRMSLFSVHVAKEGRHVCREGENMKRGELNVPRAYLQFGSALLISATCDLKRGEDKKALRDPFFGCPPCCPPQPPVLKYSTHQLCKYSMALPWPPPPPPGPNSAEACTHSERIGRRREEEEDLRPLPTTERS